MNVPIFFAGFIGALAPEIVRLYNLRQQTQTFQNWYYLVSLVYALLGGYVASIAPGVTAQWWAFAVGAGLVTVVNVAVKAGGMLVGGGGSTEAVVPEAGAGAPMGGTRGGAARTTPQEKGDLMHWLKGL